MRREAHAHPCARCKVKTECCGHVEFNYDGSPECWCVEYHGEDRREEFLCEDCAALPECDQFKTGDDCDGGKGTEARDDSGGYMPAKHFCHGCATALDTWLANYDGPNV